MPQMMKSKPFRSFHHCIKYSYFTPLQILIVKIIIAVSTLLEANPLIPCGVSVRVCGCGFPLLAPGSSPNLQFISPSSLRSKNLGWLCAHRQITQSASSWQIHFLWEISLCSIVAESSFLACASCLCSLAVAPAYAITSLLNGRNSTCSYHSPSSPRLTIFYWNLFSRLTCVCFPVQ